MGTSRPADPWELLGDALAGTEPLSDEEDLFGGGGGGITNSSTATPGLASSETIVISPDETESPRQHQVKQNIHKVNGAKGGYLPNKNMCVFNKHSIWLASVFSHRVPQPSRHM